MSYSVRDDNATFGSLASIELSNGAGAATLAAMQVCEPAGVFGLTATTFPANSFQCVWITPPNPSISTGAIPLGSQFRIQEVVIQYKVAGGAGSTLTIENVPAGTADGSGANVLAATNFSLATAVSTSPTVLPLNTNIDNLLLAPGSRVNINAGGTATTGLVNLTCIVYITRVS
jgi:hypothetical protein